MESFRNNWVRLGISALLCTIVSTAATPQEHRAPTFPMEDIHSPGEYGECNYKASYDTLGDLNAALKGENNDAQGTMRSDCVAAYTLNTLINLLNVALNNYTIINEGYDEEFEYYVKYVKDMVPEVMDNSFMWDREHETYKSYPPIGPGMKYFDCQLVDSGDTFPCTDVDSDRADKMSNNATTMMLKDKDGFNSALTEAGISPERIRFLDHTFYPAIRSDTHSYIFHRFPTAREEFDVANPKDIVTKALPTIPHLRRDMLATLMDIMLGQWTDGSISDAAQAFSTPVFMFMQAVENMADAKALGKKEEEAEKKDRKDFIVMIVSVVLVFVPIVGQEVAAASGLATLARAITLAGEVGNGALAVYDTVENPASAIINIFGMLVGIGSISKVERNGAGIGKVAKLQREMKPDTVKAIGPVFARQSKKLDTAIKFCRWS